MKNNISFKFYLRNPNDPDNESPIMAKLYDPNDPNGNYRIGVKKVKVYPSCWSVDDQIALTNRIYSKDQVDQINAGVKNAKDNINKVIFALELAGEFVTAKKVRDNYGNGMQDLRKAAAMENKNSSYILDFYDTFVSKIKNRRSGKVEAYSVYKKFEVGRKKRFKVSDINKKFMIDFQDWMLENGYAHNTIVNRTKNFKSFIKVLEDEVKVDPSFKKFTMTEEETDKFRLTLDQFNKFFLIDGLEPHLMEAKDTFILMTCIGGIRISSALVQEDDLINKVQNKASYFEMKKKKKVKVTNPMNQYAIHILENRNWKLPKVINGQHLNEHLREIISLSELKDETFIVEEKKQDKYFLRDKITTKVARKTFVSLNEDFGISRSISNAMTNHSNKTGGADDNYRFGDPKYLWERKQEAIEKWNVEYYKLFPNKIPKSDKKILKLANGADLIIMGDRVVSMA